MRELKGNKGILTRGDDEGNQDSGSESDCSGDNMTSSQLFQIKPIKRKIYSPLRKFQIKKDTPKSERLKRQEFEEEDDEEEEEEEEEEENTPITKPLSQLKKMRNVKSSKLLQSTGSIPYALTGPGAKTFAHKSQFFPSSTDTFTSTSSRIGTCRDEQENPK